MIQINVGKRVRELRLERTALSQENFAKKIGLDRTYISSVEQGKRNISIVNLEKIATALGVSLKEFFNFTEDTE